MILKVEDVISDGTSTDTVNGNPQSLDSKFQRIGNTGAWMTKDRIRNAVELSLKSNGVNNSIQ